MPDFQYKAVDSDGKNIAGIMPAISEEALEEKLQGIGCWLLEANETDTSNELDPVVSSFLPFLKKKVKRRELIDLFIQISSLLTAGVTLLEALKALQEDNQEGILTIILADLIRIVEAGNLLHEGMAKHPAIFSEQIINMVKAGEHGGTLPETFRELSTYLAWLDHLISDIKQATIYPVALVIALSIFVTILFTIVVPKFIAIIVSLKLAIPLPTRIVMMVSNLFVSYWWLIGTAIFLGPVGIRIGKKKSDKFLESWDRMKLNVPIFGNLNKMFVVSRFSQTFSSLFNAGIPILYCLELCRPLTGNKLMEIALKDAENGVREGIMLSEVLKKHDIFSPMVIRKLSVGEITGDLGTAFGNVSTFYNEEIPRHVKKVFGILEPTIMIVLISIVGFTAMAVFMPLISLLTGAG